MGKVLIAIDTIYNGYNFRSRLEARWAVFFNALDIRYQYEPEGFKLPRVLESRAKTCAQVRSEFIYYLPDFRLPQQDCWVEIKGTEPTNEESEKAHTLVKASGKNVYTFWGEMPFVQAGSLIDNGSDSAFVDSNDGFWDNYHMWCECKYCGLLGIEFEGRAERLPCQCNDEDEYLNSTSIRLTRAYMRARQYRF